MLNGIPRRMDKMGRITIPMHFRRKYDIFIGDLLYVYENDRNELVISVKKSEDSDNGTRESVWE